jgi:predicted DNA-binding transcriptional regulator YafY
VIGVTRFVDAESQIVKIETDYLTYKYIASKPMHPSHKRIKEEDGKVIFQMDVILNRELKNQILSFGANLKVMEPLSFADELKQEFQKASKIYS